MADRELPKSRGSAVDHQRDCLLRLSEVIEIVGLGKTTIYNLMRQGKFPQCYKPGGYATRWSEAEIIEWRENQRAPARSRHI